MKSLSLKTQILNSIRTLNKISWVENILARASLNGNNLAKKIIGAQDLYDKGTIRQCTRSGINYRLDISDYLDHGIYFCLTNADLDRQPLNNLVKKEFVIFDVGANIGDTALHFAKILENTGNVFCFEPVPYLFQRLKENVALNNFSNIHLINKGLSDKKEELFFSTPETGNSGGTFLSLQKNSSDAIQTISLDDFVKQNGIVQINLIKIDVEGFEMKVISGALETLKKFKPVLFIEVNDNFLKRSGSSAGELILCLLQLNYQIKRADTEEEIKTEYNFLNQHFDIICFA